MKHSLASQRHTVTIDGITTKYWQYHGDKMPTLLMIHGYRGTHRGFEQIIDELPEYNCIVPDLPGFGESAELPAGEHTIEGYARHIAALIEELKLAPVMIVGHSMGSIVVAELAKLRPDLLELIVLINPIAAHPLKGASGVVVQPSILLHWLGGKVLPARLGRKLLDSKAVLLVGSVLMAKTRDRTLRREIHSEHLTYMTSYASPAMLYESYLASLSGTVTDRAPHITIPTLLIAGDKDDLAPPATQQRLLTQLKNAELVILDKVGHLVHYETPGEAAEAIDHFIATRRRK